MAVVVVGYTALTMQVRGDHPVAPVVEVTEVISVVVTMVATATQTRVVAGEEVPRGTALVVAEATVVLESSSYDISD